MKAFLLALCLAGNLFSAWDNNVLGVYYFENNLNDSNRGLYPLTLNGTVPYNTTPQPPQGSYWPGTFTAANFLSETLMDTAIGAGSWTVEMRLRSNSISNGPVVGCWYASTVDYVTWRFLSTGEMRLVNDDVVSGTSASAVFTSGIDMFVAVTWDGTTFRGYCSALTGTSSTSVVSGVVAASVTGGSTFNIGRLAYPTAEFPFNGNIDYVVVSKVARTSFPTIPINSERSIYLKNRLKMNLGSWLPFMFLLSPSDLSAISQNQIFESNVNKSRQNTFNNDLAAKRFQNEVASRTRVTATATRTPIPSVPTATPTQTPNAQALRGR